MKNFIITFALMTIALATFAQNNPETTKPLYDVEIVRKDVTLDIEGIYYRNVTISLKTKGLFSDKVKVNVVDKWGKSIYKKTLKNAYLYVFSNGQIQVGKPHFDQIVILPKDSFGRISGIIREKEGVY